MTGLTMTDCSVADNVKQAKYELDRAEVAGGAFHGIAYAKWAMKWGRALLEVAAEHAGEDYDGELGREINDLEAEMSELRGAIRRAIDELESA